MADSFMWLRQPRSALPHAESALGLLERVHGTDNPATADALRTLAAVQANFGRFEEALGLSQRRVRILGGF